MSYPKRSYVEHVAVRVKDIQWHIRFFREALGMPIREVDGAADNPRQIWTVGGAQLIAAEDHTHDERQQAAQRNNPDGTLLGRREGR